MSRRPSRHCANKAKLVVSQQHDNQCNKLFNRFLQFCNEPWSPDEFRLGQLRSCADGPISTHPTSLLINNTPVLSVFLRAFIITMRVSDFHLAKKHGDKYKYLAGEYIDMTICTNPDLFLAVGTFKGYVASLNASINRSVYDLAKRWKDEHIQQIMNGTIDIPEWVNNPPQIDIETDGKWGGVLQAFNLMKDQCHKYRGICMHFYFYMFFLQKKNLK